MRCAFNFSRVLLLLLILSSSCSLSPLLLPLNPLLLKVGIVNVSIITSSPPFPEIISPSSTNGRASLPPLSIIDNSANMAAGSGIALGGGSILKVFSIPLLRRRSFCVIKVWFSQNEFWGSDLVLIYYTT